MSKTKKRTIGDLGEDIALEYLVNRGFRLLSRNYLKPWGELDIVVKQGNVVHFVEVKAVSREPRSSKRGVGQGEDTFRPEENLHGRKLLRLHRAIQTYLMEYKIPETVSWQIDLACVYLDFSTRRAKVEMLENIIK